MNLENPLASSTPPTEAARLIAAPAKPRGSRRKKRRAERGGLGLMMGGLGVLEEEAGRYIV